MGDSQLPENLSNCSIEELLNLSLSLDPSDSIGEKSYQYLGAMTSSIAFENSELLERKKTLHEDETVKACIETVEESNKQDPQYINLERKHSPEQPPQSDRIEVTTLRDSKQHNISVLQPTVHLQMENTAYDSSWMSNNQSTMKTCPKICLSTSQLSVLEREFKISHYPDRFTRRRLALKLNLTQLEVSEWFTNRRVKMRKLEKSNQSPLTVSTSNEPYELNFRANRLVLSKSQLAMLEREFQICQRPDCLTRQKLSLMLNLKDSQVNNWFQNRRAKMRKLNFLASGRSFQQDLAKKMIISNSQLIAIQHAFKKYQSARYSTVYKSTPTLNLTNRQVQLPQIRTSSRVAVVEHTFEKYQPTHYNTVYKSAPTLNLTNQQVQVSVTGFSSFSSSAGPNQGSNQKTLENFGQLVQPQIESSTLPPASKPLKQKRKRTNLCKSQITALEHEYKKFQYPDYDTVHRLVSTTNLTDYQVKVWFKNQRAKRKILGKHSQPEQPQTTTCDLLLSSEPPNRKQKRTPFDNSRFIALEREFKKCQCPNLVRICQLASTFNFTNSQVRRWFAIRRRKQRKSEKERQVMQLSSGIPSPSPSTEFDKRKCGTKRTNLNENQVAMLENEFGKCQYPNYEYLASIFNVSSDEIRDWFMIRRANQRKLENQDHIQNQRETPSVSPSTEFPKTKYRARTNFTQSQLAILEHEFKQRQYIDYDTACSLATILNVPYSKVRTWFVNQRSKQKNLKKLGQFEQLQSETTSLRPTNNLHLIEAQPCNKQIQQYGNDQQPPIAHAEYNNNTLSNSLQQTKFFPQGWHFQSYNNRTSSLLVQQGYGIGWIPMFQENQFFSNSAPASAQYAFLPAYNAPENNQILPLE